MLAALARIGTSSQLVHRDSKRFVGFLRDRSVGHRTGIEAGDNRADRLHLVERNGWPCGSKLKQSTNCHQTLGLLIDAPCVLAEDVETFCSSRVLQRKHGLWIKEVLFTFAPPLIFTADTQGAMRLWASRQWVCIAVACFGFAGNIGK